MPDHDQVSSDLLAAAKRAPLTRAGVASIAARLRESGEEVDSAVDAALARADGAAATVLLLATAAAGRPADVEMVGLALPILPELEAMIPLVVSAVGDATSVIVDAVSHGRLDSSTRALALAVAAHLVEGDPPAELLVELRRHARMETSARNGLYYGVAARRLRDPYLLEVAERWVQLAESFGEDPVAGDIELARTTPLLDQVPDEEAPRSVFGFTVRRAVKKVGRNEPCPCGSGKKYKLCCLDADQERLAKPSPVAGVTMEEYRAHAHEHVDAVELQAFTAHELVALGVDNLPTEHLLVALDTWTRAHFWEQAERALDILEDREDVRHDRAVSDHRADLITEAIRSGEVEVVRRQRQRLELDDYPDVSLALELLEPTSDTLGDLECLVRGCLADGDGIRLIELAHTMLAQHPGLGILMARGVIGPDHDLDSAVLLEVIEEARDRLQLPPGDPALDAYDALLGREVEVQAARLDARAHAREASELERVADELRQQLEAAAARSTELDRQLEAATSELTSRSERPPAAPAVRAVDAISDDQEMRRLRNKVSELKGLLSDSHTQRRALRKQLAEAARNLGDAQPNSEPTPRAGLDAQPLAMEQSRYARPLVPRFSVVAERAFKSAPAEIAAAALRLIADLAIGRRSPASHVKRLDQTKDDVWSARVGIHYRLLVSFRGDEALLYVHDLVARKDFERAVKSL